VLSRFGLDHLGAQAGKLFQQPFAALTPPLADRVFKPLLVVWTYDPPADAHQRCVTELRADLRMATTNSALYVKANVNSGRRRRRFLLAADRPNPPLSYAHANSY